MGNFDTRAGEVTEQLFVDPELHRGELEVVFGGRIGHREMGPEGFELEMRRAADQLGQFHQGLRVGTDAVHAGIDLQMNADRPTYGSCCELGCPDALGGVDGRDEPMRHGFGHGLGSGLGQDQHRSAHPCSPQLDPLVDDGYPEPRGSTLERCTTHGDRTVPVGVGLHDGAEPGRGTEPAENTGVVADTVESTSAHTGRRVASAGIRRCSLVAGTFGVIHHPGKPLGDQIGEILGDEPLCRSETGGPPVDVGGEGGSLEWVGSPGYEGSDHPGQDVSGPGRCEAGATGGHDPNCGGCVAATRSGHHGRRTFEQEDGPGRLRGPGRGSDPVRAGGIPEHLRVLAGVGCKNEGPGVRVAFPGEFGDLLGTSEREESIGVDDDRDRRPGDHGAHVGGGPGFAPDARTDDDGAATLCNVEHRLRPAVPG